METNTDTTEKTTRRNVAFLVLGLATEIGFIIAVPLVVLVLGGVKLDERLGTAPLFILLAFIVSLVISSLIIARKLKALN